MPALPPLFGIATVLFGTVVALGLRYSARAGRPENAIAVSEVVAAVGPGVPLLIGQPFDLSLTVAAFRVRDEAGAEVAEIASHTRRTACHSFAARGVTYHVDSLLTWSQTLVLHRAGEDRELARMALRRLCRTVSFADGIVLRVVPRWSRPGHLRVLDAEGRETGRIGSVGTGSTRVLSGVGDRPLHERLFLMCL